MGDNETMNAKLREAEVRQEASEAMQRRLYATTDAMVWATEFVATLKNNPSIVVDEGFMVGWFANALETAKVHALRPTPGPTVGCSVHGMVFWWEGSCHWGTQGPGICPRPLAADVKPYDPVEELMLLEPGS